MNGQNIFTTLDDAPQFVFRGPLLEDVARSASDPSGSYAVLKNVVAGGRNSVLEALDKCDVRGRAGGGFPVAHKWWLVANSQAQLKCFVCNITAVQPGSFKERFLVRENPDAIVEATLIGAYLTGAHAAFICISEHLDSEFQLLNAALQNARDQACLSSDVLGSGTEIDLQVIRTPMRYIAGEETALLECIEGRPPQPRGKPPLPTEKGVRGCPTAISNLETLLQVRYALRVGAQRYRSLGTTTAPGTMMFSLSGDVQRPGIYELPLGVSLRRLVFDFGCGLSNRGPVRAIFPGGISSPALPEHSLDVCLEFETVRLRGSSLGSGCVIVVSGDRSVVDIAKQLSDFFAANSCGKCKPCWDGTSRIQTLMHNLHRLNEPGIDVLSTQQHERESSNVFRILQAPRAGTTYADRFHGLDKITALCDFVKYRGDCRYSFEVAESIQSLLSHFRSEFEEAAGLTCLTTVDAQ